MKKIILALGMFAAVVSASAKQQSTFSRSVYSSFSSYPVNTVQGDATRKALSKAFPGWYAYTDKLNGTITTAYGPGIVLPGNTPADKALYCIEHKLAAFGINKGDWKQVSNVTANGKTYLYYNQVINGHNVFMSRLSFQFSGEGQLLKIQMKNYGNADKTLLPAVSSADALNTAISDLTGANISDKQLSASWDWFPVPTATGYVLHPSWHFIIKGRTENMPIRLSGYVDGITGELLYRTNEIKDDFDLTVKGNVYKNGTLNPATLESLPDLTLNILGTDYTTDTAGHYSNSLLSLPLSPTIPLAGLWSTVYDSVTYGPVYFTQLVSTLGTTYTYPVNAPSSNRHVNAYYHVNRVHNYMKQYFPAFTGMDFSLPTNVDLQSGTCNAYYDGASINFFAAGGGCNSFAELGDVVYHEYGHGISDHMYTEISGQSIQNAAMNEANSDIWALSITGSPIMALNAFTTYQGFIRRYDMTPQFYPQDLMAQPYADPHENGQIIAGAWWDVGANIGISAMMNLFTNVYYDAPDGPDGTEGSVYQSILLDALLADDNDNNPTNGTPHYSQIVAAFAKHGIYLEQDVTFTHQELDNMQAGVAIPVTATLGMQNTSPFQGLLLYYRRHTANTWDSLVMSTTNSTTYTATIPAQDTATIIDYYFAIRDVLNVTNAYFPIGFNPSLPSYQSTIPYQFGVGINAVDTTDFETSPAGWHIGNNAGDNAQGGKWARVIPVINQYFNAYPPTDHTAGSGTRCLLTGNGGSGFSFTSVNAGTTTVLSPVLDISSYSHPVIEYYRWFSNDLSENFKNDPWQVMIKDAAASHWHMVENTYQSDYNWRKRIFAVNEFLPAGTTSIQIKFAASDSVLSNWADGGQSLTVGGIDDFYMYDAKAHHDGVANIAAAKAKIYPNPADKLLDITFPNSSTAYTITMYDLTGKSVYTAQVNGQPAHHIDISQLPSGVYTLFIQADKSVQSQKVVVTHK